MNSPHIGTIYIWGQSAAGRHSVAYIIHGRTPQQQKSDVHSSKSRTIEWIDSEWVGSAQICFHSDERGGKTGSRHLPLIARALGSAVSSSNVFYFTLSAFCCCQTLGKVNMHIAKPRTKDEHLDWYNRSKTDLTFDLSRKEEIWTFSSHLNGPFVGCGLSWWHAGLR